MNGNPQSRKWLLTINNPLNIELSHSRIKELLVLFNPDYFCIVDEISTTGTPHTHVFLYSHSPIRFNTIKNRFPTAHADKAQGSVKECRDYLRKEGKWKNTDKEQTNIKDTFEEVGEIPNPNNESNPEVEEIVEEIKAGKSTYEILRSHPKYTFRSRDIDTLRQTYLYNQFRTKIRRVKTIYIKCIAEINASQLIYRVIPADDICRITYYRKNGIDFDSYLGQKILIFDGFSSQVPLESMVRYLDGLPAMLPARFNDRIACFDTVIIVSYLDLENQYIADRDYHKTLYCTFLKQINYALTFDGNNDYEKLKSIYEEITND